MKDVLVAVRNKSDGLEPVGWYHSHIRSEIFLTEADLAIHDRYFPELWQVALVVRPSTTEHERAGFFFREIGGSIQASASYREFQIEPLGGGPTLPKAAVPLALRAPESKSPPVKRSGPQTPLDRPNPPPSPVPSAVSTPVGRADSGSQLIELPRVLRNEAPLKAGRTRIPAFVIVMVCLILLGGLTHAARDAVLPRISRFAGRVSPSGGPAPTIGPVMTISAIDDEEFQIQWDTGSRSIQEARSAALAIVDGGVAQHIPLDAAH